MNNGLRNTEIYEKTSFEPVRQRREAKKLSPFKSPMKMAKPEDGLHPDPISLSIDIENRNPSVSFRESRRKLIRVDMFHIPILKG
jgi:hypothetical protein